MNETTLSSSTASTADKKPNPTLLIESIDRIAAYDFENRKVFGSAYCVFSDDTMLLQKCYGTLSPTTNEPVTDRTLFRLASMTKPISAFAALLLVDRGLLSLDTPIDVFLPAFKSISIVDGSGACSKPLRLPTVRDILTHSSGIASGFGKIDGMPLADKASLDRSIDYYVAKGLDYEPSTAQMYSGTSAFDVLVRIIELVLGKPYPIFLKEEIFDVCDMPDTTFSPTDAQKSRLIAMHCRDSNSNESSVFPMPEGCIFEDYPCAHYLGGAGLVSTLHDYANFARLLLNGGQFGGKRLIKDEAFRLLCTPQISETIMNGNERWGLGVRVITKESYPDLPIGAYGWSGAYGSHFWIDPQNRLFAILMKNSKVDGGAGNQSARHLEHAVYSSFE